ncbi:MAG: hypothetical protein KC415_03620 [Anaerolineales bacterium]|nr:hypothetical protein [Anaerolineales bacterium]
MKAKTSNTVRWIHIVAAISLLIVFILYNQLQIEAVQPFQGLAMILSLITGIILAIPFIRGQWRSFQRKRNKG